VNNCQHGTKCGCLSIPIDGVPDRHYIDGMARELQTATERVARLLAREARLLSKCGDADDARAANELAELLADNRRLSRALSKDRQQCQPARKTA
jgi:hypothetical protein